MKNRQAGEMPALLKKEKNSFLLDLNTDLYRDDIVKKALSEDKDWVKAATAREKDHIRLRFNTADITDVMDWMNYLIYLHKV